MNSDPIGAALTSVALLVIAAVLVAFLLVWPIVAIARLLGHRLAGRVIALLLILLYLASPVPRIALAVLFVTVEPSRLPLVGLDLLLSRIQRETIVGMAGRNELAAAEYGDLRLPWWATGLSVHGTVHVDRGGCGRVFFMTITGFSPDPYGGLEFVPPRCEVDPDPLGSGEGTATELGGGWYWIEAT